MQWRKSNEPCYNGAGYIMMIMNMQSRNRCKALFVQTSVRGQKDFWFISTSSDAAEELRCLWFVLWYDLTPYCLFIYNINISFWWCLVYCAAPCLQAVGNFFLFLNLLWPLSIERFEKVCLHGRQQEMVERIRCICCLHPFKSVIPISSIWGVCVCSMQLLHSRFSVSLQVSRLSSPSGRCAQVANFLNDEC